MITDIGKVQTFYCSIACQVNHAEDHVLTCKRRKRLWRAVSMLKQNWTAFEEASLMNTFEIVSFNDQKITLKHKDLIEMAHLGECIFTGNPIATIPAEASQKVRAALLVDKDRKSVV